MGFQHVGGEECVLAAFDFNRETWAGMGKGLLLQDQGGAKGTTSALARGVEVSCADQWDSSLVGRDLLWGMWPGRREEDREGLDGPV